jgi:hypothetical protein
MEPSSTGRRRLLPSEGITEFPLTAGKDVTAGTMAMVSLTDFLRASERATAIATLKSQRGIRDRLGILHRLNTLATLDQLAGGGFRVGVGESSANFIAVTSDICLWPAWWLARACDGGVCPSWVDRTRLDRQPT